MQTRQICLAFPPTGETFKKRKWEENHCNLSPCSVAYRHAQNCIFGVCIVFITVILCALLWQRRLLFSQHFHIIMCMWLPLWGAIHASVLGTTNLPIRHKREKEMFVCFLFDWCSPKRCSIPCTCFHLETIKIQAPWTVGCSNCVPFPGACG